MTIKAKKSSINLREKLAELLNFRQIRDRLDGLGLYLGKDRTGTAENLAVRGGANVDDLQLAEISAALGGTAVDVFVYDTRNDSDGGKWRERTQHTSWYNEELNTSTRGGRREFPAVAVIVAEADKVTIYDGDDPDLNMWMVFNANANDLIAMVTGGAAIDITSVSALNSVIAMGRGANNGRGMYTVDFLKDTGTYRGINTFYVYSGNIVDRNNARGATALSSVGIVDISVNDVAMTVLPNAPIDADTGLPVPTIAVATDGGVSVIKDDGSVVDITRGTGSSLVNSISFDNNNKLIINNSGTGACYYNIDIPSVDLVQTEFGGYVLWTESVPASNDDLVADSKVLKNYVGHASSGLNILEKGPTSQSDGMIAYTTSSYNTGWMPGDIKLAALSDTKNETVGVDESSELLVDGSGNWIGDFDVAADVSEWTATSDVTVERDTSIYTNGAIKITQTASSGKGVYKAITTEIGKKYVVSADGVGDSGTNSNAVLEIGTTAMGAELGTSIIGLGSTAGSISVVFEATSTTTYISLGPTGSDNRIAYFDNISIKQTGELVTNGTFDNGTEEWTEGSGWSISGGVGVASSISSTSLNSNIFTTVVGKTYTVSFELVSRTAGTVLLYAYDTSNIANSGEQSVPGMYSFNFVARQTSTQLYFFSTTSFSGAVDNISVRLAEEDRSVNDKGLQVFGEIDKTPVAPGADLVAYSGFSADNYLMQPYNPDLDFGTGDFCIIGWAKNSDSSSTYKTLLYRNTADISGNLGKNNGNSGWQVMLNLQNELYCHVYGDANNLTGIGLNSGFSLTDGSWHQFAVIYTGGVTKIFIDGIMKNSISVDHGNFDNSQAILSVGSRPVISSNLEFTGSLALTRVGKTAPTDEQIAKIYRDEKALFADGAQATLYGTSDAVTALAYDDKTELLHVGTASGRSDFSGLRRINNTTIPVTTSISASNNLIAEQ